MNDEWDNVSNDPEDCEEQVDIGEGTGSYSIGGSTIRDAYGGYDTYIDASMAMNSNEIIRVSSENDFECSRHGRVQSFRLFANGYGGMRPPREVNCCLHCFMDMISRQCNAQDSDHDRREQEHRDMMSALMTANTRIDPPIRMAYGRDND